MRHCRRQCRTPGRESFTDFAQRFRDFLDENSRRHEDRVIVTVGWRLSPAILAHVCRGVSLEAAIRDNAKIDGPFTSG
jgi:broad specificity phosphatase PhoE